MDEVTIPLPTEESTPPVTKTYLTIQRDLRDNKLLNCV
jgi:hypothetical protein